MPIFAGEILTANKLELYLAKPVIQLRRRTNQSIPNNTITAIQWNEQVLIDTLFYSHSTGTNPDRIVPLLPGRYWVEFTVHYAANATGDRRAYVGVNGSALAPVHRSINLSNAASTTRVGRIVECDGSSTTITALTLQSSGSSLDVVGASGIADTFQSFFSMHYIGPSF